MPRFVAFLRAVNVGGRFVIMPTLVSVFEDLGFDGLSTFIASGNVVFRARSASAVARAPQIESALRHALGFEVATFVRTESEIQALAGRRGFPDVKLAEAKALNVFFLRAGLSATQLAQLRALRSDDDEFAARGTEIFWLCRRRQSESKVSNASLERKLSIQATMRSLSTVQRLAARLSA